MKTEDELELEGKSCCHGCGNWVPAEELSGEPDGDAYCSDCNDSLADEESPGLRPWQYR